MINLLMAIALGSYVRKSGLLSAVSNSLQKEIASLSEQASDQIRQIHSLKDEINELTLNRLPGLIGLSYDEVLKINKEYVKNIVFTRTGKKDSRFYEYKIVLENRDSELQPALKILLYNRSGVQVGSSELSNDAQQGGLTRLDRDEVRAHYAVFQLPNDSNPEYFQVVLL